MKDSIVYQGFNPYKGGHVLGGGGNGSGHLSIGANADRGGFLVEHDHPGRIGLR